MDIFRSADYARESLEREKETAQEIEVSDDLINPDFEDTFSDQAAKSISDLIEKCLEKSHLPHPREICDD